LASWKLDILSACSLLAKVTNILIDVLAVTNYFNNYQSTSDKEKTLESLRLKQPYYLRRSGHNTERCIKIIDGLIKQYVEKYSEECNQENLLLIRGLWMLRQHPRLFVRREQWVILLSIAQNMSDDV
jgi:hypothetical protein